MHDIELREEDTPPIARGIGSEFFIRETCETSDGCTLHWHECLEFFYMIKGSATLSIEKNNYSLEAGTVVAINPNELHRTMNFANNTKHLVMKIPRPFLEIQNPDFYRITFLDPLFSNQTSFQNIIVGDMRLSTLFEKILDCTSAKEYGWELAFKGLVFEILSVLFSAHITKTTQTTAERKETGRIKKAIIYINDHFKENIRLDDISAFSGYSSAHMCRMFKETCGVAPIDYLNCVRCENAAKLLFQTRLSVTEISLSTGFSDSNYFARVFKKIKGKSPSEYRKQYKNIQQIE